MEINQNELLAIIGAKEVELYLLRRKVAAMEEALKNLAPKSSEDLV